MSATRETVIERAAHDAARTWANACRVELSKQGRRIEGGWPGTLPEARMRASAEASRVLTELSMSALTHTELAHLARITYHEARRSWRSTAAP